MNEKKLSEDDQKALNVLGIRKKIKLIRISTGLYNSYCNDCKALILREPKLPMEKLCKTCQKNRQEAEKKIEKLTK